VKDIYSGYNPLSFEALLDTNNVGKEAGGVGDGSKEFFAAALLAGSNIGYDLRSRHALRKKMGCVSADDGGGE